jgi:membrane fusion protein, macrolide-specific efflux system
MKKLFVSLFILALMAGVGWLLFEKREKGQGTGLQAITVTEGAIEQTVEATGSVSPLNRVEIKPPISGRIEKLLVDEGDRVKEGQVLAWMSSSDRAAILDAARSQGPESIKHWEDAYKPTPIVAPLSGVVILKNVVVGQTVDPTGVLFAMSDFLIVLAQVDESDIGHVHVGMPAWITLDAYPNNRVEGKIFDILYEGKNVSNVITYGVKVKPTKVPPFFRSQMTANISFIVSKKEKALLLPLTVVQDMANGKKQVSIPGPDGKPVPREIKTGIENNDKIEVVSGLALGEKVLITRSKYTPQQSPQSSPLTSGRR